MIFGLSFRLIIIALALVAERVGRLFRNVPFLSRLIASDPPLIEDEDYG